MPDGVGGASTALYVDTHCHLDRFEATERASIVDNAVAAGVTEMVTIGTRFSESDKVISIARSATAARIWCTVGTHPDHAGDEAEVSAEQIARMAEDPVVIGIGETGLDYVDADTDRDRQKRVFRNHIEAARLTGLPVVIHARGADDDTADLLGDEFARAPFAFVLHCFASGQALAARGIELGGFVSFSGILTFPKSQKLREIAGRLPQDRLLIETDAPFLAPVPRRGRRNEPAYVVHTAQVLGEILGKSAEATADLTRTNFRRLFAKAS